MGAQAEPVAYDGRTAWARNVASPVRDFLTTETGRASVLVSATVPALLRANPPSSHTYEPFWGTQLSIAIGATGSRPAPLGQRAG